MLAVRLRFQDYIRFYRIRFPAVSSTDIYAVHKVVPFWPKSVWTGRPGGDEWICLFTLAFIATPELASFIFTIFRCFVWISTCLAVCCWFWIVVHFFDPYLAEVCRIQCRFLLAVRFDLKLSESKSSSRFRNQTEGERFYSVVRTWAVTIDRKNANGHFVCAFIYSRIMFVPCSSAARSTTAMFLSAFQIICNVETREECIQLCRT